MTFCANEIIWAKLPRGEGRDEGGVQLIIRDLAARSSSAAEYAQVAVGIDEEFKIRPHFLEAELL